MVHNQKSFQVTKQINIRHHPIFWM